MTAPLTDELLRGLDPRQDLEVLRGALAHRLQDGVSVDAIYDWLAARDPVVLAELSVGPRAPTGAVAVRAALRQLTALERVLGPAPLYRRLADLGGDAAGDVLDAAIARHPDATWLPKLSVAVEGPEAGRRHLAALRGRTGYRAALRAWIDAKHPGAVVREVVETGEVVGLLVLIGADQRAATVAAAAGLLDAAPEAPVVPWLAAAWGPDLDPLLTDVVGAVQRTASLEALGAWLGPTPGAAAARLRRLGRA